MFFSLWRRKKDQNINVEVLICRMPGKAYARRKQVWMSGVNEVDSKIFSRAISAKVYFLLFIHHYTVYLLLLI